MSSLNAVQQKQETAKGEVLYVLPGQEQSYWQPQGANGFASVFISPALVKMDAKFSIGTQMLPPGGVIREHNHTDNEEVLHFIAGEGKALIDGVEHRLVKGATLFLGKGRKHTFINDSQADLQWIWFMTPNGLEDFFRDIGRPRQEGEPTPEPFGRPDNVAEIEKNTVFAVADVSKA